MRTYLFSATFPETIQLRLTKLMERVGNPNEQPISIDIDNEINNSDEYNEYDDNDAPAPFMN